MISGQNGHGQPIWLNICISICLIGLAELSLAQYILRRSSENFQQSAPWIFLERLTIAGIGKNFLKVLKSYLSGRKQVKI